MTHEELKHFDGRDGAKAYVAYKGKVYDVTESPLWKKGEHQKVHRAGQDLTPMLAAAPHGDEVFKKFKVVAKLEEAASTSVSEEPFKAALRRLYRKYHPHPMLVHFPIALHIFAAGLDLLFFAQPKTAYAVGVYYAFFVATVMGFFAMIPGMLSWWINYDLATSRPFVVKLVVATLTLLFGVVGILLYLENPGIVYERSFEGIAYHAIILLTGAAVIVLGYYGGKITWGESMEADTERVPANSVKPSSSVSEKLPAAGSYDVPFLSSPAIPPVEKAHEEAADDTEEERSIAILIGGAAGSGIDTLEKLLSSALKESGYYLFSTKEYMSRVRGGSNTALIRISNRPVEAPCKGVDIFIALDAAALGHAKWRCGETTVILADESFAADESDATAIPMKAMLRNLGGQRYLNTYAAGLLFGVLKVEEKALLQCVGEFFKEDGINESAVKAGLEKGKELTFPTLPALPKRHVADVGKLHLMDGTTASGFGFLSGGCNFVAAYPMSPSTGLLNFMASMSEEFTIAVEQSEDEIASLHMVLGAWYAGARALTTTSGGGFALMGEALSLSGMTETPAVIYLAQRPGPATGLPTRSEQGDLNMALHSGHGPFTRLILAPGSLRECIDFGYLAFELADRYQIPVIFLSDQYLADSMAMVGEVDFAAYEQRRYIVSTEKEYARYSDTESGVTPRGIPGFGEGLVAAVGDEHDEQGQITEDAAMREKMVAKRARKAALLMSEAIAPTVTGEGSIAVIGWGSTRGAIAEALRRMNDPRLVQVHFGWVHPLDPKHLTFLKNYSHTVVVENSADGAFADTLLLHDISVSKRVLQSNGFAFFADELAARLSKEIKALS